MEYGIGLEWNCLFSVSSASLINFSLLSSISSLQFRVCCIVAYGWQTAGSFADLQRWQQRALWLFLFMRRIILNFFRPAPSPGDGTRRCILNENKTNQPCCWPLYTLGEAFRHSASKCVACLKTQTGNFSKPAVFLPFFMAEKNGGEEITNLMPQMKFWQCFWSLPAMLTFIRKA